jgi:hypothetical protein
MEKAIFVQGISCGILKNEISFLIDSGKLDIPFIFLSSLLHLEPSRLDNELKEVIACSLRKCTDILLVFGDCHPYMHEMTAHRNIRRVKGMNCYDILLGREHYRELMRQGAFFILQEWLENWEFIFTQSLGLNKKTASEVMTQTHTELVCLDTRTCEISENKLKAISNFTGLPYRKIEISLAYLERSIVNELERYGG